MRKNLMIYAEKSMSTNSLLYYLSDMIPLKKRWNINKIILHFYGEEGCRKLTSLQISAFKTCLKNMYLSLPLKYEIGIPLKIITNPSPLQFMITMCLIFQQQISNRTVSPCSNNSVFTQYSSYLFLKKYDELFQFYNVKCIKGPDSEVSATLCDCMDILKGLLNCGNIIIRCCCLLLIHE